MSKLLDYALESLEQEDTKAIQKALIIIAEVAAVNRISGYSSDILPEADKEILSQAELEKLQKTVIGFIEKNPDDSNASSAFWTLGKFHDEALEPTYAKWLEYYFLKATRPAMALGQIIAAINVSGVQVISGSSFSADDYGKNLSDAATYLKKGNKDLPS
jgi:hypothetical protein